MKLLLLFSVIFFPWNIGICQMDSTRSNPFLKHIKPIPIYPKYPESYLNVGIGLGSNYGGMGGKAVFGFKNSGICLGVGANGAYAGIGYNLGVQLSYKFLYTSFTYGTYPYSMAVSGGGYSVPVGFHNVLGVMVGLGKTKRNVLDLGVEISYGGFVVGNRNILSGSGGSIGTIVYADNSSSNLYSGMNKLYVVHFGLVIGYFYRIGNKNIWKR